MKYIYSRVSTDDQQTANQLYSLQLRYPDAQEVSETISGTKATKPVLEALLARLQPGDTLIIAALDRLGRKAWRAIKLMDELYERGITIVSVRESIDYSTSAGRMTANIMLSVAQMERDLISERTKASLQRLKAQGLQLGRPKIPPGELPPAHWKRIGRPVKHDKVTIATLIEYRRMGLTIKQINKLTNISTGRICQLLKVA